MLAAQVDVPPTLSCSPASQGHHDPARAGGPDAGSIAVAERCERGAQHCLGALEVRRTGVVVVGEAFLHGQEDRDDRGGQRSWRDGVARQSGLVGDRRGDELLDGLLAGTLDGAHVRVGEQQAVAKPCEVVRLGAECALGVDPAADAVEGVAVIGVGIGLTGIAALSAVADLSSAVVSLAAMLGLAVGIDYALLMISRYRTLAQRGMSLESAAGQAAGTAGTAVVSPARRSSARSSRSWSPACRSCAPWASPPPAPSPSPS
jgi:hypothetical protein